MNNIVRFFDQSTVHISNWPKHVLHWLTLVWLLAHSCFWGFGNHVGNFFWSITQCSIRSIRLRSIRSVFYDWPNFFSRSRLQSIRTLCFRSRLTESLSVNAKFGRYGSYVFKSIIWPQFLNYQNLQNFKLRQRTKGLLMVIRSVQLDPKFLLERCSGQTTCWSRRRPDPESPTPRWTRQTGWRRRSRRTSPCPSRSTSSCRWCWWCWKSWRLT